MPSGRSSKPTGSTYILIIRSTFFGRAEAGRNAQTARMTAPASTSTSSNNRRRISKKKEARAQLLLALIHLTIGHASATSETELRWPLLLMVESPQRGGGVHLLTSATRWITPHARQQYLKQTNTAVCKKYVNIVSVGAWVRACLRALASTIGLLPPFRSILGFFIFFLIILRIKTNVCIFQRL